VALVVALLVLVVPPAPVVLVVVVVPPTMVPVVAVVPVVVPPIVAPPPVPVVAPLVAPRLLVIVPSTPSAGALSEHAIEPRVVPAIREESLSPEENIDVSPFCVTVCSCHGSPGGSPLCLPPLDTPSRHAESRGEPTPQHPRSPAPGQLYFSKFRKTFQ